MKINGFLLKVFCFLIVGGLIVFYYSLPPCRIVESAYVKSILTELPHRGLVIRQIPEISKAFTSYGVKDVPLWLKNLKLADDEILVLFPNAQITGTAPFHESMFIVEITKGDGPGIGIALLKGNVNMTVKFNGW